MSKLSNLAERLKASAAEGYQALELDGDLCDDLQAIQQDTPAAMQVRPHKDGGGVEAGRGLLESLHTVDTTRFRGRNVSPAHSFEVRYSDDAETINLQFVPGTADAYDDLAIHVSDEYPNAITERVDPELLPFEAGHFVSGAELELNRYALYPIKNEELNGFRRDPWGSITSEMVGSAGASNTSVDVVSQVVFRPVGDDWVMGVNGDASVQDLAYQLRQPTIERRRKVFTKEKVEYDASKQDKRVADMLQDLAGEKGWSLNLRVFAVSPDPDAAVARAKKVANKFRNYYETSTQQRFEPIPLRGPDLRDGLRHAVGREWNDQGIVKSEAETAGLVHAMDDQINTQKFDWALANPGTGVPPRTARYDFEAAGVANGTDDEKALAMLDRPEYGDDAMWFGFGRQSGIEAGVYEEFLNAHAQVTGRTRMGKTTLATNFGSQIMERGYGALAIMLGKEDDDEAFIAEWPEDRPEEDFVFIDTGDDFEQRARFNLLEIPDELEAGSAEHTSYMESLADDFCAAFAQAGGDGELYPLMRGITRTLVRGMAQSEMTCTPIDLAAACSSAANMERFSEWMTDERIDFIKETAQRFADKEDADLEPIARRMDEITHNANLRTWLSARDPSVRIQDVVDEGKVAVMRLDPAMGNTERAFATNPIVRRFAHAKKMAAKSGENTDPFYLIWDEADKSATVHSNLDQLLSEFGGYGFRCCLIYQAPSNQLPDGLKDATESQIDTTLSFRTTGRDGKFISNQHSIEASDLNTLPRYSLYMNTDTKGGDPTESYMVEAIRPIREIRQDFGEAEAMTDDDISAMKRRSAERYGEEPPTDQEIKARSHFFAEEPDDEEQDDDEADDSPAVVRAAALRAIYDEGFFADDPEGYVTIDEATDRIERYVDQVAPDTRVESPSQIEAILGGIPPARLEREHHDESGETRVRTTGEGKMQFLSPIDEDADDDEISENVGGFEHAELMRGAYDDLLEADLPIRVCRQGGDNDPDAIGVPEAEELHSARSNSGIDPTDVASLVAQFREENPLLDRLTDGKPVDIEAEHSTGDTAPAATLEHIARTLDNDRRCLLLARPETAEGIVTRLDDHPKCMRSFSGEDGAHRLYNANSPIRVGANDIRVYRPAGGQSVWLYHDEADSVELRDSDGTSRAWFDDPEDVFSDPTAYPATEDDIGDASEWSVVKRPVVPTVAFGEGGLDRSMVDVIEVDGDGDLIVLEDGGDHRIPLGELGDSEDGPSDSASGRGRVSPGTSTNEPENTDGRPNVF